MSTVPILSHDIHVHTFLSACSGDPEAVPDGMLASAARHGLETIGFADHLWDAEVAGSSDWYRPQDLAHTSQIRAQIPTETHGVRVLIGCETEYVGGGVVGISPAWCPTAISTWRALCAPQRSGRRARWPSSCGSASLRSSSWK